MPPFVDPRATICIWLVWQSDVKRWKIHATGDAFHVVMEAAQASAIGPQITRMLVQAVKDELEDLPYEHQY